MSRLDEPIPRAWLREDVARARWVRFDLAAQLRDVDMQVVRLGGVCLAPHFVQDCAVREQLALVASEEYEQCASLRRELNPVAAHRHRMRLEVDAELSDLEDRLARAVRPAECGA